MKKYQKTSDAKKGGLFVGKSHAKGGIPAIVVDTGQEIEVEGGEAIINKEATKKYWKELSAINQSAGGGVPIPPPMEFSGEVERYKGGGKITMSAIRQGTEIEMEHAKTIQEYKKSGISVKEVAQKIAKDHLRENPNYYKVLTKLKLAKGGEIVCRSCGNSWHRNEKYFGKNFYECDKCGNKNNKFYKKGGNADVCWDGYEMFGMKTKSGRQVPNCIPIRNKYAKGGQFSVSEKEQIYKEWKSLVNMSKSELQEFYNSTEGKKAGLSSSEARQLGIDNGRTSARWIMKMKDLPFVSWSPTMWKWAKKQISFIKRMSGNKGSLYDENEKKTRKHTSLLIWGHNPEKYGLGGQTDAQKEKIGVVMHEFKEGKLFSSSGQKVTDRKQAIAIALSEAEASKYAKGSKIPSKNKGGDCYYVAGTIAMSEKLPKLAKEFKIPNFVGTPYVVHAEVSGQGAISGLRYGHAWVEDDLNVYDFSNGREIVFPKHIYYLIGNVIEKKPKYYKYTFKEAIDRMLSTGHYGSWELITESGL